MKVRYELTLDDRLEYAMTLLRRPSYVRAFRMRQLFAVALFGVVGTGYGLLGGGRHAPALILLFGFVFALVLPALWRAQTRRQAAALFADGENRVLHAVQEMALTPEAMIVSNEFMETRLSWRAIEEISETENLLVFDVTSVSGHMVPPRSFESAAACRQFLETARAHVARARSGMLPPADVERPGKMDSEASGPEGVARM